MAASPIDTKAQKIWLFMLMRKKGHSLSEMCKKRGEAVTPDPHLLSPNIESSILGIRSGFKYVFTKVVKTN